MKPNPSDRFRNLVLVFAGVAMILLFGGYGNKLVHPDLNALMVRKFLDRNNKGDLSLPEFKKYTFYFQDGVTLKGRAVVKDGLFSDMDQTAAGIGLGTNLSSEGMEEKSPQQWIIHGGYAADVPEVPASLRHFYDPVQPPGKRYLTDISNAKIMGSLQKYVFTNPQIDGVQWALGKADDVSEGVQDHKYTWEHGKTWMKMALQTTNPEKKNEYMAGAWRALGETLHMIADNGCPPHVRNDAHPSPLFNNNTWLGNPDPYEEILDKIRLEQPDVFTEMATGNADPLLKERFSKMNTVYKIADSLARYTNAHFVSNETISGKTKSGQQIRQITHPENAYASPRLENMTYNESDYSYSTPDGVKQCLDHYYAANLIPTLCDPFVSEECVRSQAAALLPDIVEAGANVIRLFIPKLTVEIKSAANGLVKGEIRHQTNPEYPAVIKYTGEVTLSVRDDKYNEIDQVKVQAKNGLFEQPGMTLPEGGKLTATIDCGGISVHSSDFVIQKGASAPTAWVTKKQFRGFDFSIGLMARSNVNSNGSKFKSTEAWSYEIQGHGGIPGPEHPGIVFTQKGNVLTETWDYEYNRNGAFRTYKGSATIILLSENKVSCDIREVEYFRIHSEAPLQTISFDCAIRELAVQPTGVDGVVIFAARNPCSLLKSLHYSTISTIDQVVLESYFCIPNRDNQYIHLMLFEKETL